MSRIHATLSILDRVMRPNTALPWFSTRYNAATFSLVSSSSGMSRDPGTRTHTRARARGWGDGESGVGVKHVLFISTGVLLCPSYDF